MKKTSRIHMPIYNDGLFEVFEIIEDDSVLANTSLQSKDISMTYQELGVSDRLRSDLDSHDIDIQLKIDDKLILDDSLHSSPFSSMRKAPSMQIVLL